MTHDTAEIESVLDTLADARRRAALRALADHDGPIHLRHLAHLLADNEPGDASEHLVALYHSHLLDLTDADLIEISWHTRQIRPVETSKRAVGMLDELEVVR